MLEHSYSKEGHGMKHLIEDSFFIDRFPIFIQDILERMGPESPKGHT